MGINSMETTLEGIETRDRPLQMALNVLHGHSRPLGYDAHLIFNFNYAWKLTKRNFNNLHKLLEELGPWIVSFKTKEFELFYILILIIQPLGFCSQWRRWIFHDNFLISLHCKFTQAWSRTKFRLRNSRPSHWTSRHNSS